MFNLSKFTISLFGIGFFPIGSGTIGSLFSIIFFFIFLDYFSITNLIFIFTLIFIFSLYAINNYSNKIKKDDASEIIIDEFLGINLIIIFYDFITFTNDLLMCFLIFILFRIFDIIKIFPANWIDKNIKNSWGVILDDIIAGVYTVITLYILNAFF